MTSQTQIQSRHCLPARHPIAHDDEPGDLQSATVPCQALPYLSTPAWTLADPVTHLDPPDAAIARLYYVVGGRATLHRSNPTRSSSLRSICGAVAVSRTSCIMAPPANIHQPGAQASFLNSTLRLPSLDLQLQAAPPSSPSPSPSLSPTSYSYSDSAAGAIIMTSPARAEHIGSLKRPDALLRKRADFARGKCTAAELRAVEDACIADVVRMQLELGLPVVTDGEFRRGLFYEGVFEKLGGMKAMRMPPEHYFQSFTFVKTLPSTLITVDKLRRAEPLYADDFDFVKSILGPEDISKLKVTMCAPEWLHFRHGSYACESSAYTSDTEYFADLARIYREEIQDLHSRGCRRIQMDDPIFSCFCDEAYRAQMTQAGVDPRRLLDTYIALYNDCLRAKPADMVIGLHICRGNIKPDATPFTQGPYDWIAERLFTGSDFDCFYLEYDSERAGGFGPLRHLPRNKRVVLGLVSTKTRELEDPTSLRERIMQAADAIAHGDDPRPPEEALAQCVHAYTLLVLQRTSW
uniref:Transcriptional repressor TUP1 n=1 Tax=Ganoderma boninense TaxID=34458 RepID=A0A5K1K4A8_9APHY|nr:Transcriptional repressor TUP1 [Ganoderma boninense]